MIDLADYAAWDATAMAHHVRAGDVRAAELDEACRTLIDLLDPAVHAIGDVADVSIGDDDAVVGPFAGVPFAVKELLAVPGLPWTMGSRLMATNTTSDTSAYVARLLAAGLRIVCSTTSSEFGLLGSTESVLRGATVNPWRPGLSAGGSSGGAAAAVAAGIVPIAHANDAGGSIRVPASMNGLFGFKPSKHRVEPSGPDAGGLVSLVVDHCVSRSVRDSAALLVATQRRDRNAPFVPIGDPSDGNAPRLRIATITTTLLGAPPDPQVLVAVERTRDLCARLGHHPVEVAPAVIDGPALSEAFFTTAAQTMAGVAAMFTPLLGRPPGPAELEPFTLELIEWAASLPPDAGARAAQVMQQSADAYLRMFDHCDVVLSPTLTRPPWPLGTLAPHLGRAALIERTEELVGYTPIHNISGSPAMSLPLEWVDGLPVGMHFAAAPGADAALLDLAFELEGAQSWAARRPPCVVPQLDELCRKS